MKTTTWRAAFLAVFAVLPAGGCSHTDQGIVGGGILGAGLGALAGGRRNAGAGALIGGATGAVVGGALGSREDSRDRRVAAVEAAAAQSVNRGPVTVDDVLTMAASGTSDSVIISQIRTTRSTFALSNDDIVRLTNARVSESVVREMQATTGRPVVGVRPVHVYERVPVYHPCPQPVYVVPAYPPPPPSIGVGIRIR